MMIKRRIEAYVNPVSGSVATLANWRADYESMDRELWSPKDTGDWLADAGLVKIDLELTQDAYPISPADANRIVYVASAKTDDDDERNYEIMWVFDRRDHDDITQDGDCGSLDFSQDNIFDIREI